MKNVPISSIVVGLAAAAVLLGCLLPGGVGTWSLAGGAALLPVALIVLGAGAKERAAGRIRLVPAALALTLLGTLAALIVLHRAGRAGDTGLLLLLTGIWLLPLILTGLGHALTFPTARAGADRDRRRRRERP